MAPKLGLSFVIPVRGQPELLERLLKSIHANGPEGWKLEVVVVDDGPSASIERVCVAHGARYVSHGAGRGPAQARNTGAAASTHEYLFFMDADVICAPGLVESGTRTVEKHPEAGGVSFINQAYDSSDGVIRNFGAALEHYWFNSFFGGDEQEARIRGFTTRNGLVRKVAFEAVGGFDTTYSTNAHEDYDFGKRLAARYPLFMVRSPVVYHSFPASLWRLIRNYWVRITLFVPYYLSHRPALERAQTSPHEAVLRMTGFGALVGLLAALAPIPGRWVWGLLSLLLAGCYAFGISGFLAMGRRVSGTWGFPIKALCIHYVTTLVIVVGGAWALGKFVCLPQKHVLKSRLH